MHFEIQKKNIVILVALMLGVGLVSAQSPHYYVELIDNQGNRAQTYPNVTVVNPEIQAMVEQVDTVNLYNSIAWMQQYVRDGYSPEALLIQNWLVEQFEAIGLEPSVFYFYVEGQVNDTLDAGNVIAVQRGTKYPDEYIVISSHYDHPDGPGADDNASGTAGMLEAARILSQYEFDRSIIYASFNLEEDGQWGSLEYAKECARQDMDILGVFNLDMLGWYPPELDTIKMFTACYHLTRNLYDYYTTVANLYLPETPTLWRTDGEFGGGDHRDFYLYEYPAIYIGDVEYIDEHPCYHELCDTIGSGVNNFALARAFVQATIAATAELANGDLPPRHLAATCGTGSIHVRWDEADYADHYKLYRDNELMAEPFDTSFDDTSADDGLLHEYYVTAVMPNGTESHPSNRDRMQVTPPLPFPFSNDFDENIDGFYFSDSLWIKKDNELQNTCEGAQNRNDYFSYAETRWFTIPPDTPDATLSFDSYASNFNYTPVSVQHFMVEATTDRVHWHKIAAIKKTGSVLLKEVSLRDFIGEPYVQVRLLLENLQNIPYNGKEEEERAAFVKIDNFAIDFSSVSVPEHKYKPLVALELCPNPAKDIVEVRTDLEDSYSLSVYNILGIKVMDIPGFSNGQLDISVLPAGAYFVKAAKDGHSIAKKIVKQ